LLDEYFIRAKMCLVLSSCVFLKTRAFVFHAQIMNFLALSFFPDMQDFSKLPSKTVTEVLMLEMKMSPAAKAYLISGYPRSMRDVVEYTEKVCVPQSVINSAGLIAIIPITQIQVLNGVILISWRQSVLKKQIDFGAKLGHGDNRKCAVAIA
jgi:uncharacterized membrane protein YjgN (DUF898 family)